MTDRELLKEARDLIVMCSLIDKSGQCEAMADKIDKQLSIANVSICLERAKKYARHQHFLGAQGKELVEFEDWAAKD